MTEADDRAELRELARAFRRLSEWAHSSADERRNEVTALVTSYLRDAAAESVVSRQLHPFEQVNLQTALDAWCAEDGRSADLHGIAVPPHFGEVLLQQLISGEGLPPIRLSAPAFVDLPNGPARTLACLRLAALLVEDSHGRYVVFVAGPGEHDPSLRLEVAGLPVATAQAVLAELDALRLRLNVYRGQIIEPEFGPLGITLAFAGLRALPREDVILPEPVLARVENHALGLAAHRAALLSAGQHLKRGLLLYGPPGTGKTHTVRYLVTQMTGYTRVLLAGRSLHAIGAVAELARDLQPAVIVLEDIDLVAEDRSFGPGGNSVLFDLLDAMDGAAPDADLLFLLTTNRVDLLEPALAARPGRVDVAVSIELPDADARRRLLALYARDVPWQLTDADNSAIIERTEGVTASFTKELVRRAVLHALERGEPLTAVTAADAESALTDLLDASQAITRKLLGVGVDPEDLPPGGVGPGPVPARAGWMRAPTAYRSRMHIRYDT